jgi:hypothetical protein
MQLETMALFATPSQSNESHVTRKRSRKIFAVLEAIQPDSLQHIPFLETLHERRFVVFVSWKVESSASS